MPRIQRMRRCTPPSLPSSLRSDRRACCAALGETFPNEPSPSPGVSQRRNACVWVSVSQGCAVVRVVTPQTSLAVVAVSNPITRLIKELLPTPVSPATTTLREERLFWGASQCCLDVDRVRVAYLDWLAVLAIDVGVRVDLVYKGWLEQESSRPAARQDLDAWLPRAILVGRKRGERWLQMARMLDIRSLSLNEGSSCLCTHLPIQNAQV